MNIRSLLSVITCISFLFLLPPSLYAQDAVKGVISGAVSDEKNEAQQSVIVNLLRASDSVIVKITLSEKDGSFIFENIPAGSYLVSASKKGVPGIMHGPVIISSGQPAVNGIQIRFKVATTQQETVTVTGQRPLVERKIDRIILNVENSPLAIGNTALDVIGRAPGVSVDNEGRISLKGKQGVNVMIDGKPTYLSQTDLANMLRATDGGNIQSIEIITNPSAKYDASGNSGIINIKMKKNRALGTNGSLSLGSGWGEKYKANTGLTINHRNKKFNLFASYNFLYNKRPQDMTIDRLNEAASGKTYLSQEGSSIREYANNSAKAGIDYTVSPLATLGFMLTGYGNKTQYNSNDQTRIGAIRQAADSTLATVSNGTSRFRNYAANINYKAKLDSQGKKELSIDLDYSRFNNKDIYNYDSYLRRTAFPLNDTAMIRNITPSLITIYSLKADYTYPVNGGHMEMGVKASYIRTDNNFNSDSLINFEWQRSAASNHFVYDENVNAAYLNYYKEFGDTKIQAGLRAEQTNSKGNSLTLRKVVNRSYLNLFPTFYVSRAFGEDHELTFSYGRRVNRPNYEHLNPFVYFIDRYTFREGNPFLTPQFSNMVGLYYTYKSQYTASFEVNRTTDVITQVLLQDTAAKTLFQTNQNLASEIEYNFNLNIPVKVTKWWTSTNDITAFYLGYKTPNLMGAKFSSGRTGLLVNSNNAFTLTPSLRMEVVADYKSPLVLGTVEMSKPQFFVDMGVNYLFPKKRSSIKFSVSDVFNTLEQHLASVIPAVNYNIFQKNETRVFRLTYTYRFGRREIKAVQPRQSSVEAETNRTRKSN